MQESYPRGGSFNRNLIKCLVVGFLVLTGHSLLADETARIERQFYVSPMGNDANPGTIDRPFLTVARARNVVRMVNHQMRGNIVVSLRGGTYPVSRPIEFTSADSGVNGFDVVYQAYQKEIPVLSGGVAVSGWTLDHANVYKAPLHRDFKLRSLFVNGVRAAMTKADFKSQGPSGLFNIVGNEPWAETPGSTFQGVAFNAAEVPRLINPEDVELQQKHVWCASTVCVQNISSADGKTILNLQQPYGAIAATMAWGCGLNPTGTFTIQNAFELMSKPGQFYFDRSRQILYYKSRGEDMSTASVIAPQSEGLIRIAGTSTSDRAHHLTFRGITFSYDHWLLKQVGASRAFAAVQSVGLYTRFRADGNHHADHYDMLDLPQATVELSNCDAIVFDRNRFEHLSSGIGLSLINDVVNSVVSGNVFKDLSGSAVNVGHPQHYVVGGGPLFPPGKAGSCARDVVQDNWIRDVSLDFWQEEGISALFTENLTVRHNDLANLPYGGIAVGWWWADAKIPPSKVPKDNRILDNRISKTHQILGGDGGPLYIIGEQPGGLIKGNYVTASPRSIFPDQGAAFWTITKNVIETKGSWLFIHFDNTHDIKIDDNYVTTADSTNHGTNCAVTNTHLEQAPPWSSGAQAIIDASGLEPAYRDIVP